jgi:Thrombospondin type 1 domain
MLNVLENGLLVSLDMIIVLKNFSYYIFKIFIKGPWSLCSGDCFNSSRSRTVVCIKNDGFAEESECDLKSKPSTFEDCSASDLKDCKPRWHYSEWSEVCKN